MEGHPFRAQPTDEVNNRLLLPVRNQHVSEKVVSERDPARDPPTGLPQMPHRRHRALANQIALEFGQHRETIFPAAVVVSIRSDRDTKAACEDRRRACCRYCQP